MNNIIDLSNQYLTEFTESDLIQFCDLKNIKYNELEMINLNDNKLTNLDFITNNTHFINLKNLWLINNHITDISNIQYLVNLECLGINNLNLNDEKETVKILKTASKLKYLYCSKAFKTYTKKQLEKKLSNIIIY